MVFAYEARDVSVTAKKPRNGMRRRCSFVMRKEDLEVDLPRRISLAVLGAVPSAATRVGSRQQCIAARRTQGGNSVRRVECESTPCEAIKLGQQPVLRTVCAQNIARQVVGDNEQDVGRWRGRHGARAVRPSAYRRPIGSSRRALRRRAVAGVRGARVSSL